MDKELVRTGITLVWFTRMVGVAALTALYWRYTTRATSSYSICVLDIENIIFVVQKLFVVWLAFHETVRLMLHYITYKITTW